MSLLIVVPAAIVLIIGLIAVERQRRDEKAGSKW